MNDLERRQTAGEKMESEVLDFLLDFNPCRKLTVGDVKTIAAVARRIAFDRFSEGLSGYLSLTLRKI